MPISFGTNIVDPYRLDVSDDIIRSRCFVAVARLLMSGDSTGLTSEEETNRFGPVCYLRYNAGTISQSESRGFLERQEAQPGKKPRPGE